MTQQPQYTQNVAEFVGQPVQQATPLAQASQFTDALSVQRGTQQLTPQMQSLAGSGSEAAQTNLQSEFVPSVQQTTAGRMAISQPATQQAFDPSQQMTGDVGETRGAAGVTGTTRAATTQQSGFQGQGVRAASVQGPTAQGAGFGAVQQTQAGAAGQAPLQQTGVPPIDVIDGEAELSILVDIPGFEEDDIEVKLEGDLLRITASERVRDLKDTETMTSQERPTAVRRDIQLPASVLVDDAEASYEDGVLTVELPKDEEETAVGKQIGIQ